MKPYELALLTGTHQHRWAGDHSGLCEKCHKEHQKHQYAWNVPGECRICGATGKCSHPDGFRSRGNETHACKVCYLELPHELEIIGTQDGCRKCTVCNATLGHKYASGVCEACGYACTHSASGTAVDDEKHAMRIQTCQSYVYKHPPGLQHLRVYMSACECKCIRAVYRLFAHGAERLQ